MHTSPLPLAFLAYPLNGPRMLVCSRSRCLHHLLLTMLTTSNVVLARSLAHEQELSITRYEKHTARVNSQKRGMPAYCEETHIPGPRSFHPTCSYAETSISGPSYTLHLAACVSYLL